MRAFALRRFTGCELPELPFMDLLYEQYAEVRERTPIHLVEAAGGKRYCLYRYADVAAALKDPRFGAAPAPSGVLRALRLVGLGALANAVGTGFLVALNPPDHTRLRRVLEPFFSLSAMEPMQARVHAIADELLDRARGADEFDLIAGLAAPLPVRMIAELFGFPPEDFAPLKQWSDDMAPLVDSDLQRSAPVSRLISFLRFRRRVLQLIELRRREPRADLLSALAQAHFVSGELSKDEVVGVVVFVLTAGHATTTHLIGSCALLLLNHPRELERLREDPSLVDRATEETLRVESPIQRTGRVLREDVELHGQHMPRGAKVRLMIGAANRDPRRFEDPDRFDLLRRDSNRHLAFGMGIHHCIGLHLARLETRAAIGALVRRFPKMALTSRAPRWTTGAKLRGLSELVVSV